MISLEGDNLVAFHYFIASKIWPDFRDGLCTKSDLITWEYCGNQCQLSGGIGECSDSIACD